MLEWTSTGINKALKTSLIIITYNKCLEVLLLSHRKWIILRFLRSINQLSSKKVCISSIEDFPWTLPRLGIFSVSFLSVLLIDDKMRTQKKRSCSEVSIPSRTWNVLMCQGMPVPTCGRKQHSLHTLPLQCLSFCSWILNADYLPCCHLTMSVLYTKFPQSSLD